MSLGKKGGARREVALPAREPQRTDLTTSHNPFKQYLLDTLRRSGPITFERYMALCLYHPEHGYYLQGRERTGVAGDYFTSPDLHPIFARLVARQAVEMWDLLDRPGRFAWVEMGPGRGWFARDFLRWARSRREDFFQALDYIAIEPGPRQRDRLRERLTKDGLESKVRVLTNLEELEPLTGCFFSNELVDSFPVSVVTRASGRLKEIYVTAEGETLGEKPGPLSDPAVASAVARYAKELEEGQRVEVNLRAVAWMRSVAERLARGFAITIDYGDLAERLYTPERPRGTLLTYRGHTASEDFYSAPGETDLTAHVNFSALIDAGKEAGLEATGFTTQERFLLALGESNEFADLYDPGETEISRLQARLKLKRLIHPEGMGNIFKVLIQHRGLGSPQLTGLRFQRS
jgi:SAM-dependent MidA family methyltransferase